MDTLNVSNLPDELRAWLEEKVASGLYESPEAVLTAAIQALELYELREQIAVGIRDAEEGRYTTYHAGALDLLKQRVRERGEARLAGRRRQ